MARQWTELDIIVFETFFHWSVRVTVTVNQFADCARACPPGERGCACVQACRDALERPRWMGAFETPERG